MRPRARATAILRVTFSSKGRLRAIAEALRPEASHPAGEKARAILSVRARTLTLVFEAKDSSALRAIMNSYLRMLSASLTTIDSLIQPESNSRSNKS